MKTGILLPSTKFQIAIFFFAVCALSLNAADFRLSGANRAEYWVFDSTEDYREHVEDKLKLALNYGDITLRGAFFFWTPSLPIQENLHYIDYTVSYDKDPVNLLYGRYYTTFGRGMTLNAFLDEDFRLDNSLYGAKVDIKYFKSRLTLLTGAPRNIFFEENLYTIKNDTADQIRGANLETRLIPKTTLGGRYVRVNRQVDLTPQSFTELFGGNIGVLLGPFEAYFEYARQWGSHPVIGGRLKGDGIFFNLGYAISGLGISFQYMDYDTIGFGGAGYRYNEPPTPIKSGISVNRGIDEKGFGITINASPLDWVTAELNYNQIKTHDEEDGVVEQIVKTTSYIGPNLQVIAGVNRLVKDGIELEVEEKTELKPNIEATYNFGAFFIETGYEHNFISSDTSDYYEHAASFSIGKPELLVFTLRYERRNRIPEWLILKYGDETAWPIAELSLDLTTRHNLRIRVGGEKGGLVCSGGVCRFEEPFKGVKLVLTSIF